MRRGAIGGMALALATSWSAFVTAQDTARGSAAQDSAVQDMGLELVLDGPRRAARGGTWVVRGRALEVHGLASLDPAAGARVTARAVPEGAPAGAPAEATSARDGSFVIHVPIPDLRSSTAVPVRFTTTHRGAERTQDVSVAFRRPFQVDLRTDRRFHQLGEPVHAWALVRDPVTLAPAPGREVSLRLVGADQDTQRATVRTDASGVAHHVFTARAPAGSARVEAVVAGSLDSLPIEIGRRTQERLLVTLEWPEEHVAPSGTFHPEVRVIAPSGAPARDAVVTLTVGGMTPVQGRTDSGGVWSAEVTAPAYLANDSGTVEVTAAIRHPSFGSARTQATLRLASRQGYRVQAFAPGGLAFGLDTPVYFALADAGGVRAPAGVALTVKTPLLRSGSVQLTTDANGLAETTLRAAAMHVVPGLCNRLGVPLTANVGDGADQELCLPAHEAEIALRTNDAVREPGDPLVVDLRRHPRIARRPIMVRLHSGATGDLLAVQTAGPASTRVTFETPRAVGLLRIRASAVLDEDRAASAEGIAHETAVLVRPPNPVFIEAEPDAERYEVGGEATVSVRTGAAPGWLAVDVRDLAQHGGERAFALDSLHGTFDRAVLDPSTPDAERLIRTALAVHVPAPAAPTRATPEQFSSGPPRPHTEGGEARLLLDPVVQARVVAREQAGRGMALLEAALRERGFDALADGTGRARGFDAQVVDALLAESPLRTLGDRPLTLAHLKEADATFRFPLAGRRIARERLIAALRALVSGIDADQIDATRPERWVSEMVRELHLDPVALRDPWGGPLGARRRPTGVVAPSPDASEWTLAFPGPDGRLGTNDDIVDPFARIVPEGTLYAHASGEEALLHAFSMIVPVRETLEAWKEALTRVTAAMEAVLRGELASAEQVGESFGFGGMGLGTIGHGSGGGGGSGYGRGRGSRAPRVRTGHAAIAPSLAALSGRVREDFPGTLLFVPTVPTGDDGSTTVRIPLADAATTYLVEVVHWRGDGWSHSTRTRFRTEKPLIVEAPLPAVAHVGEVLRIPVRARSRAAMNVAVSVIAEGDVEVAVGEPVSVHVEAGGATVGHVEVKVLSAGTGALVAIARGDEHDDAVRLPFRAIRDVRRVTRVDERLLHGSAPLTFGATEREGDAWAMQPAQVTLSAGLSLFGDGSTSEWEEWASALRDPTARASVTRANTLLGVSVRWRDRGLSDETARGQLIEASRSLEDRNDDAVTRALQLLALAPAWRARGERPALREDLERLRDSLSSAVEDDATQSSDDAGLHAIAAAALAHHGERSLAGELARRARRSLVRFGDDLWLPARSRHQQSRGASAALGLADVALGEPAEAFALLRTITDQRRREPRLHGGLHWIDEGLAAALAAQLGGEPLERVQVTLAGRARAVRLHEGRATFTAKTRRGRGALPVVIPEGHLAFVRVVTELGLPWPETHQLDGPLRVAVEPGAAQLDRSVQTTLTVRNAVPRSIREPELTVTLPAGAVLDERARARLDARLASPVTVEPGRLRMRLRPLLPGMSVELPIELRYEIGGTLSGFGVDAYALDRDDLRTVVPPQTIAVTEAGR